MNATRGSVRNSLRITRSAEEIWEMVGDPGRLHEWFPGIVSSKVTGDERVIETASGLSLPEKLLTVDRIQRRFQYRITAPIFNEHLGTVDVHDLGDGSSLVVYSVDADPAVMALVIGGAAGAALEKLRDLLDRCD